MNFKHFEHEELGGLSSFFLTHISNDFKSMDSSDLDRISFQGGGFYLEQEGKLLSLTLYASTLERVFINYSTPFVDVLDKSKIGYMGLSWVEKSLRGQGIQKKLIGLREERLKSKNVDGVLSLVHKDNIASFNSFTRLGYGVVDELFIKGEYSRSIFYKNIK
ncbi:MAG: GNAT family N-acetyltransferase [Candidatus Woesearchaeota archaeon]